MDSIVERLPARGARSAGCPGTHGGQLGPGQQTYVRRQPEQTVLHRVIREHLETFLAEARQRSGGEGLPRFVERELREFLTCGVMAHEIALPDGAILRSDDATASSKLSELLGRQVTLWPLQPPEKTDHYRRAAPDNPDKMEELRQIFGRNLDADTDRHRDRHGVADAHPDCYADRHGLGNHDASGRNRSHLHRSRPVCVDELR